MLIDLIPPLWSNSNIDYHQTEQKHINTFSAPNIELYSPFIFKTFYKNYPWLLFINSKITIHDLGCGWWPLAYSLAQLIIEEGSISQEILEYIGVDIKQENINFLKDAYSKFRAFSFHYHATKESVDYIGDYKHMELNSGKTTPFSNGDECLYSFLKPNSICIQWSSSLITHITPSAVENMLTTIYRTLKPGGIAINCLMLADPLAIRAMNVGITDRKLPIDHGPYLTYSDQNPLLCTAYKPEWLLTKYALNKLKIIDIQFGHWRGDASRNEIGHYQDVIVAQKIF